MTGIETLIPDSRIIIISCQEEPCRSWAAYLSGRGWRVERASSGTGITARRAAGPLPVILVEESMAGQLPVFIGTDADKTCPVLLFAKQGTLSSRKVAEHLAAGCDDVIFCDIDPRVLEAKLLVNLRWARPAGCADEVRSRSGKVLVNRPQRKVVLTRPGGADRSASLTRIEAEILMLLVKREGDVVERQFIVENVWRDKVVNSENVDKHVESLRGKLSCLAGNIETVYGAGYCYREAA